MRTVTMTFKRIEISEYSPQNDFYTIRIIFSDGKDKALEKKSAMDNPEVQVETWLAEIKSKSKQANKPSISLSEGPLGGVVILKYAQDIEEISEKMVRFLNSAKEQVRSAKLSQVSYGDMQKKIKGSYLNF